LLLTAIFWGGNFTAIKELLKTLQPFDVIFVRAAGAFLFFLCYLKWTGKMLIPLRRQDALRLVLLGVVGITVMNLAMVFGQRLLPAAMASLIVTSNPIFTVVIAALLGQEMIRRRTVVGIALAAIGFMIVLLYGSGTTPELVGGHLKGIGLVVLAPISWAFYTVLSKPMLVRYPPFHVAAYTAIAGTVSFMTIPLFNEGTISRIASLDGRGWAAAIFASLLAYAVAYLLWYQGLEVLSPSQTAVYIYLVPVFGLISARLVLGEQITPYLLLGGGTILAGVIITNSRRQAKQAPTPEHDATAALSEQLSPGRPPISEPIGGVRVVSDEHSRADYGLDRP
jgi:drug/metabolite transporter (DMT)-like permease